MSRTMEREKRNFDRASRVWFSTRISFAATVLFALYNGFLGIRMLSIWNGSICVFYVLLAAIRGSILLTEKRIRQMIESERERFRKRTFAASSIMLLALNLALALPISLMVLQKKPVRMGLIPAIAMATYTTYKVTMAAINIQRQDNLLVKELRIINFIDALVSVLVLQNTLIMVNQANANPADMLTLSSISSAAIYVAIIAITLYLLKSRSKSV